MLSQPSVSVEALSGYGGAAYVFGERLEGARRPVAMLDVVLAGAACAGGWWMRRHEAALQAKAERAARSWTKRIVAARDGRTPGRACQICQKPGDRPRSALRLVEARAHRGDRDRVRGRTGRVTPHGVDGCDQTAVIASHFSVPMATFRMRPGRRKIDQNPYSSRSVWGRVPIESALARGLRNANLPTLAHPQ
jgi:hypothetical protein